MAASETQIRPETRDQTDIEHPQLWNVVLLDDQHHTYDYVVEMMQKLFAHDQIKAFKIAVAVDKLGRAVCLTTHKEHAELKCEQIHAYGPDKHIAACQGSMSSIIEPAEFEGDDDDATRDEHPRP